MIGPGVSEEKLFENFEGQLTCNFWPRSINDIDLKNFIVVETENINIPNGTIATKKMHFFNFLNSKA